MGNVASGDIYIDSLSSCCYSCVKGDSMEKDVKDQLTEKLLQYFLIKLIMNMKG